MALESVVGFGKGFALGVGEGMVSLAEGAWSLAKGGYALATDAGAREQAWEATKSGARAAKDAVVYAKDYYSRGSKEQIANDFRQTWLDARDGANGLYTEFDKARQAAEARGEGGKFWGRIAGRGGFEAAALFVPVTKVVQGMRAAKAQKIVAGAGKAADVAADVLPCGRAVSTLSKPVKAVHVTTNPAATHGILSGVDPARLNPKSRFGAAFYVAQEPETALAELAHHGVKPVHGIRLDLDSSKMRVLDFTDPHTASNFGYSGGPITGKTQALGDEALKLGYNVIKYPSMRDPGGINYAILDDFNEIVKPVMVSPVAP